MWLVRKEKDVVMKKSVMLTLLALGVSTNALWGGIALAEYDPVTKTDTLTNQIVSSTWEM